MKKQIKKNKCIFILSIMFIRGHADASGGLTFSSSRGLKSDDIVSTSATFLVNEKIMRKLFYTGSLAYSTGFNAEYEATRGNLYIMTQGMGYTFSDKFSLSTSVGVAYDDHKLKFNDRIRFNASYLLWD